MLDTDTKRRIDSCRDILVGKVPDPKSQVEQITIALIYKFMNDMDAQSEEFGGKRSFFVNGFEKYSWSKLLAPNMGGQDTLNLYSEAIGKMTENTHLPALFRDIFKNAYLPYRDPETLKAFLKEIDGFSYDHSERLGDAFEYLLSVLGSQGDAGQFRTPRDIIDFIVRIVNPQKNERILDPACGTAGFLISAWKHILSQNQERKPGDKLTPDERNRLAANIHGYDISPDMVRLSLVNLYLHGFTDPHVDEYDTLTSEDKWNEHADVILANPPFMSPKGGIKPHKRFSIKASRSEILFVDYIHEHLSPNGRAAIIVPEGVVFQNNSAYKQLRELLIKESLVGVISLPSGVFQPYSGVKTSVLILDKKVAKKGGPVIFSEVKNIGVSLGIKRAKLEKNDLPAVIEDYQSFANNGELSGVSWVSDRATIISNGSNLSVSAYRPIKQSGSVRHARIGDVCKVEKGSASSTKTPAGQYPLYVTAEAPLTSDSYQFDGENVCVPLISSTGHGRASIKRIHFATGKFALANLLAAIQPRNTNELSAKFLYLILDRCKDELASLMQGAANVSMKPEDIAAFEIPIPPIEAQLELVKEVERYQKIIDGARQVVENYRPRIVVKPEWPIVELGEVCNIGGKITIEIDGSLPSFGADSIESNTGQLLKIETAATQNVRGPVYEYDGERLLYSKIRPYLNKLAIVDLHGYCSSDMYPLLPDPEKVEIHYLAAYMLSDSFNESIKCHYERASIPKINQAQLFGTTIPLPPVDVQQLIVADLNAEQFLIKANKELIARFESKIRTVIDRVWGSE